MRNRWDVLFLATVLTLSGAIYAQDKCDFKDEIEGADLPPCRPLQSGGQLCPILKGRNDQLHPNYDKVWAHPEQKDNFEVADKPGSLTRSHLSGCLQPSPGFAWADPSNPDDFTIAEEESAPTPGPTLPPCISAEPGGMRILSANTPCKGPGGQSTQRYLISGMAKVEAQQKEEAWCWAAVIQIVARAQRVPLNQDAIVQDVKGKIQAEGANFDEITSYFDVGWHGKPGVPGTWTSDSLAYRMSSSGADAEPAPASTDGHAIFDGAPPAPMILRYFQVGWPMVLAYENSDGGGHAVVAFGGDFENTSGGLTLRTITIYDPLTGTEGNEEWKFFSRRLIGAWFPTIALRDGCNVFTSGQPTDPRCQSPVQGTGTPVPRGRVF